MSRYVNYKVPLNGVVSEINFNTTIIYTSNTITQSTNSKTRMILHPQTLFLREQFQNQLENQVNNSVTNRLP